MLLTIEYRQQTVLTGVEMLFLSFQFNCGTSATTEKQTQDKLVVEKQISASSFTIKQSQFC